MGGAFARDLLESSRRAAIATPSWIYLLDTHGDEGIELGEGPHLGSQDSSLELVEFHAEGLAVVRRGFNPPEPGCPPETEIVYVTEEGLFRWSGGEPVRIGGRYFAATW